MRNSNINTPEVVAKHEHDEVAVALDMGHQVINKQLTIPIGSQIKVAGA